MADRKERFLPRAAAVELRFRDESHPSDHATYLWYDPANPRLKMVVIVSGCLGCVEANLDPRRPDPAGDLPGSATSTYRISPWKLAFSGRIAGDPYPMNGLVVVLSRKGAVAGSEIVQLWLPKAQHALATTILNSFGTHS